MIGLTYQKERRIFFMKETFEAFNGGELRLPNMTVKFEDIPWSKHPETGGDYSFHLVRIAPNKSILDHIHDPQLETHEVIAGYGTCVNDGKEIAYEPGVISIMPTKVHHAVNAGPEGLYLFAKFFPALC